MVVTRIVRRHALRFASACFVASLMGGGAWAGFVAPASYVATPGQGQAQGGVFNYFDDTGSQLTDSVLGVNDWTANLGNGPAYEWVAWRTVDPTITFTFSAPVTIDQVDIDFNHTEVAGIYLPPSVTINGEPFVVGANAIPDFSRGWLSFPLAAPFTGTSLTVSLSDADASRWIFVDEFRFQGTAVAAVPEPGIIPTVLAFTGGVALGIVRARRRKRSSLR